MHRFLLIVLILLLPLRAVAGDAMALSMVAAQSPSQSQAQSPSPSPSQSQAMPADCVMAAADGGAADSSCSDCQLCVAVADLQPPAPVILVGLAHAARAAGAPAFASAAARSSFRPPKH